jgi:hypothetical protein
MGELIAWVQTNWVNIIQVYLAVIGLASVIVKLTPTLKDDTWLLNVTKFIAKFIALNTNTPEVRPK